MPQDCMIAAYANDGKRLAGFGARRAITDSLMKS